MLGPEGECQPFDGRITLAGYKTLDDGGLALEEVVEDVGALERGAIVGEDEAGGGVVHANFYSRVGVSIVFSSQKVGVVRQISCGSMSIPKRKAQLRHIRTVRIRRYCGAGDGYVSDQDGLMDVGGGEMDECRVKGWSLLTGMLSARR